MISPEHLKETYTYLKRDLFELEKRQIKEIYKGMTKDTQKRPPREIY